MDSNLMVMGIGLILLLCLSAFMSASEMALTSLNPIRLKMHADEGNKRAKKALKLLDNYNLTITSIVVGNNIVNILLPTISTLFFTAIIPNPSIAIFTSTVLMTIVVIFFGEIIPKIYGKDQQEALIYKIVNMLDFLIKLLYIITQLFLVITNFIQNHFFPKDELNSIEIEEELLSRIEEGVEEGSLNEKEEELIRNAIEFEDIRVEEILRPKVDVFMLNVDTDIDEIFKLVNEERYSRIPVYEHDTDNIIGILNERDFLTAYVDHGDLDLRTLLREVNFIPDTMRISLLLPQLQKDRTHLAMVVDEHGTIQGLITVEDIIEELVGEIWDEHDDVEIAITKIDEQTYQVNGSVTLSEFNEYFEDLVGHEIESEQENTIAGYVIELIQQIPNPGQKAEDEFYTYEVHEMDNNRIDSLIIEIKEGD